MTAGVVLYALVFELAIEAIDRAGVAFVRDAFHCVSSHGGSPLSDG
jgi:hypothetical protein